MPNIKTIRASSHPLGTGDFTTIQAWEDYADDKVNPYQWAECYSGFDLGVFNLAGWTSSPTSSGYPRIFAASGESHGGTLTRGPIIAGTIGSEGGTPSTSDVNTIAVNFAKIEGIGSTRGFHMNLDSASNMLIENCWATSEDNACFKALADVSTTTSSGNIIRNCVAIGTNGNDVGFEIGGTNMIGGKPGIECYNNTAYSHKNTGFKIANTKLPGFYGGSDVTLRNCISMDAKGSDFSYTFISNGVQGNGKYVSSHNLSGDSSAGTYGSGNLTNQITANVFSSPHNGITITNSSGAISVAASGDFRLKKNSPAIDKGCTLHSVTRDFTGFLRPNGVSYDIGAYEFVDFFPSTATLFIRGPLKSTSGVPLFLSTYLQSNNTATIYQEGYLPDSGIFPMYISSSVPDSGFIPLVVGDFGLTRTGPLYISAGESTALGGLSTYQSSLSELSDNKTSPLYLEAKINSSSLDSSLRVREYKFEQDASSDRAGTGAGVLGQSTSIGGSGNFRSFSAFKIDEELFNTGSASLFAVGASTLFPKEVSYNRSSRFDSQGFKFSTRSAFLFAESEHHCATGSFYKFDNNVNDNSSDYGFKLYASGFYAGGAGTDVTPMVESGFYQTSTRFPASSTAGSGSARFIGGTPAGIKMISNNTYYGTILVQSGSPTESDQHRIISDRRGVATSFWINKKQESQTERALKAIQGVIGNLELNSARYAASGQWGMYYVPTSIKPSGTTPFNSFKSLLSKDSEGRLKIDTKTLGGICPWVNTTAGGRMGRLMRTDSDGDLIMENLPDTMIPLEEDRWYYMQFWVDTELNSSYIRIASPAKGTPGQSGYMPEIKPITDKCQEWGSSYEVKTDADNLKLKVGGGLFREAGALPYYNLGYNSTVSGSKQEEFIIDELIVSNKVCSRAAMEEQFDSNYTNYLKQFSENAKPTLFILGS
tara:strand:+ start:358 stop:3165 length:2808 start_codon:yes stop_codon:yes gene_type:complete